MVSEEEQKDEEEDEEVYYPGEPLAGRCLLAIACMRLHMHACH